MDWISAQPRVVGAWGFVFQVKDVHRSIAFYTEKLGFNLVTNYPPLYGQVSIGRFTLILIRRDTSESPLPDWRNREPRECDRLILEVQDLPALIDELESRGVSFRDQGLQIAFGWRRIHVEDPDGNPIELFEPSRRRRARKRSNSRHNTRV